MNEEQTKETKDLGSIPGSTTGTKPSNTDPTSGTQSQANPLKRVVEVGLKPEFRNIPIRGKIQND